MSVIPVGVFDLIERGAAPTAELYENRLALVERYEAAGFAAYHVAEHHATPHGLAPAPSVFLSAVGQRTKRLRFGPLVYLLPYYHPLRLLEEICMLDQLSRGRIDVGFGRGISPLEQAVYGIPAGDAHRLYEETYRILRAGLGAETLDFAGEMYRFDAIPMSVRSFQRPRPPLWYGTSSLQSAEWVAREGVNLVTSQDTPSARVQAAQYWELRNPLPSDPQPATVALLRKIVVAETDGEARAVAERVYPQWLADFNYHHRRAGIAVRVSGDRPPTWEEFARDGRGIAGAPDTVADVLREQLRGPSFNYVVAEFFWGPMTMPEVERTVDLFARHVMPLLDSETQAASVASKLS